MPCTSLKNHVNMTAFLDQIESEAYFLLSKKNPNGQQKLIDVLSFGPKPERFLTYSPYFIDPTSQR